MQPLLRAFPFNLLMLVGCGAVAWATAQADAQLGLPSLAHPAGMAVGALLVALGLRLRLLALALGIVLDFWVKWEELTLAAKFGDEYVAYRARTPCWGWQR